MQKYLPLPLLIHLCFLCSGPLFAQVLPTNSSRPEIVLQIGHVNKVTAVVWSPNGKIVASGGKDQSVKLWNPQTGALLFSLTTHAGPVLAVTFSPDSRILYAASQDGSVRAWDVSTGTLIGSVALHEGLWTASAISCTGVALLVASAEDTQSVTLWRGDPQLSSSGKVVATLSGHPKAVHALRFSTDGALLASGSDDGTVKYWDTEDGSLQRTLRGHAMTINAVAFSADSAFLADASDDGITQVWNLATGKSQHELQMNRPGDGIAAVVFSPSGQSLVTGGDGGVHHNEYVMLWDTLTEKQTRIFQGHTRYVTAAAFSPEGKILATGSRDDTVRFWNTETGKQTHLAGGLQSIPCLAYSSDGSLLASGSADASVRLWNARTGELQQVLHGHTKAVHAAAFAASGKTLATGSLDRTVRLWNTETGQTLRVLPGAAGPVNALSFSPDSSKLAGGTGTDLADGNLQIWDAKTGTLLQTLNGESLAMVRAVAWSPDGKFMATGSGLRDEGEVRVWDAHTGALISKEIGGAVSSVSYSADGKLLVTGSATLDDQGNANGEELKVWNGRTQALQQTLTAKMPEGGINGVAILPDGKTVVTAGQDDQVRLWNAKSDQAPQSLSGHLGPVLSVAVSPDGKTFASAGQDNTIHLWSILTSRTLATLIPLPTAQNAQVSDDWLTVTPAGYYDASPGAARYIQWRVGPDLFPVDAYERTLNRPDLLRKALREEEVPETDGNQKFARGQSVPPAITITTPTEGQQVTGSMLTVQMNVTGVTKVSHIEVLANGRLLNAKPLEIGSKPLFIGAKPLSIGAKPLEIGAKPLEVGAKPLEIGAKPIPIGHTILQQFQIQTPLPPGEANLTLTALASDVDGLQARQEIHVIHPSAAGAVGNLYVLSVGVSHYRNPKFNLKYANRDAEAFADLWKRQAGSLYQHVVVTSLLDEQATSTNVRAALFSLVEKATEADTVALFFSGHGIQVNDADYYFATEEIDPLTAASTAASALPWTALQTTLASVRARHVLMFLDACHSGNALGGQEASSERMAELLVKRSGVMVYASSRGGEYSYEVDSLQHGAFTEALIEGLGPTGKADLDIGGQRDGLITAEELLAYLRARVPQLSGNRQTPSCPLLRDFGETYALARTH